MRYQHRAVLEIALFLGCFGSVTLSTATHGVHDVTETGLNAENCTAPWFYYDEANGTCKCGSELGGIVKCMPDGTVALLIGYCMYFDNSTNFTTVINCPYDTSPINPPEHLRLVMKTNRSGLNNFMCDRLQRTGPYCELCTDNHGVSVYTQELECYPCDGGLKPWVKYLSLELGFVTVFYLVIAICQINVTSAAVSAFIFFGQIVVSLLVFELGVFQASLKNFSYGFIRVLQTCYGIWNLDFFRAFIVEPFCVSSEISNLQFIALQYFSVIYSFFLIFLTFILVQLYRKNFRVVICLWAPFQKVYKTFNVTTWNSNTVIVNLLSSFCVLTYTKVIFNSANLVKSAPVYDMYTHSYVFLKPKHLFLQPSTLYFSSTHLPYAVLAIVATLLAMTLPVFLVLYPSALFQRFLKKRKTIKKLYLHLFAANFQRCYKNGILENHDYRYFAGFYFILRIAIITARSAISHHIASWVAPSVIFLTGAIIIAIFRPYRQRIFNILDGILMFLFAVACCLIALATYETKKYFSRFLFFVVFAIAAAPLFILILYLSAHVIQRAWEHLHRRRGYTEIPEYGSDEVEPRNGTGTGASVEVDSQTGQSSYQ